jgi:hypothetical protein
VPKALQNERVITRPTSKPVVWKTKRRPWRVVPLALFAVAATVAFTGAAAQVFHQLNGDRNSAQILRAELHSILER